MHQVRPASPPPENGLHAPALPLIAPSNIEPPIEYCTQVFKDSCMIKKIKNQLHFILLKYLLNSRQPACFAPSAKMYFRKR
jgi:hypothetical protein